MYSYYHYQTGGQKCCRGMKYFIASLRLLANLAGFICLCILVNWSSGVNYENLDKIHKLSIATLTVLCAYILLAIICFKFREKKNPIIYFLFIITLLLWIARYVLFVILMYYVEGCNLEKYNKKKKRSQIRKLRKVFHAFAIMEIITGSIDQVDNLIPEINEDYK